MRDGFEISPRRVARFLVACVSALTALSAVGWYCKLALDTRLLGLARAFDVDYEHSVPTWFSVLDLTFAAILLTVIVALLRKRGETKNQFAWVALAIGFWFLSVDELIGVHEEVGKHIQARWTPTGYWTFGWVIPAVVIVPALGVAFLGFLRRLPTRRRSQFLAAGAVYLAGCIGMDMIGGKVAGTYEPASTPVYLVCTHLEEFLEMSGVVLFNYALLEHLSGLLGAAGLTLKAASE